MHDGLFKLSQGNTQSGLHFKDRTIEKPGISRLLSRLKPLQQDQCDTAKSIFYEKASELIRTRRVPQLSKRFRFYLTNTLACDIELLANLFQRVVGVHVDTEAHAQHFRLARSETSENRVRRLPQA